MKKPSPKERLENLKEAFAEYDIPWPKFPAGPYKLDADDWVWDEAKKQYVKVEEV